MRQWDGRMINLNVYLAVDLPQGSILSMTYTLANLTSTLLVK